MSAPSGTRVLLIGWDAADWKVINPLLDAGQLPNLERFVEQGVIGNLATLYPVLSPMLWTSIATGKRAYKHGILGFTDPDPYSGRIRPVTNLGRKAKAIWNILNQNDKRCHVVGWWPSHPAEPIRGVMVSNHYQRATAGADESWTMFPGTIYPPRLEQSLANLRIHPHELDGDALLPFVPRAAEVDPANDKRLFSLARTLAECASVHAAATALMQLEPWDFMAVYYDTIDHVCHGFMRYHPPRQSWVPESDYETYKDVVTGIYRFHDMMLGTLLKLAGDDTTVILISDHGFHSDELRPQHVPNEPAGPAAEHRSFGVFSMKGPGVRRDERIYGAGLLDVTPTVLTLFGLPLGRDMDGKALVDAFEKPPAAEYVESWEDIPGDSGQHPEGLRLGPIESRQALSQLVALGYLEEPEADQRQAVAETERELQYNLARAYMGANRHADAAPILDKCWRDWPAEQRFGVKLLDCQLEMQRVVEARATLDRIVAAKRQYAVEAQDALHKLLVDRESTDSDDFTPAERRLVHSLRRRAGTNEPALSYLEASVLCAEGRYREALVQLRGAERAQIHHRRSVFRSMGEIHIELREWDDADQCFRQALELDPEDARSHLGLGQCHLARRRNRDAAESARASIGIFFHNPTAHYLLGVALRRCRRIRQAIAALETAVSQNPTFAEAQTLLEMLHERRVETPDSAVLHERFAGVNSQRIHVRRECRSVSANETPVIETASPSMPLPPSSERAPILPGETITIVSGLPRSGTSMMMQALEAGGMTLLTDHARRADDGNPRGYYEYEKSKTLWRDCAWLLEAKGKALKVIAQLVSFLPPGLHYKFIFMEREIREVLSSQRHMVERLRRERPDASDASLADAFSKQLAQAKAFAAGRLGADVLTIAHREAVYDAVVVMRRVAEFLRRAELKLDAMVVIVDRRLYRQRV
jgi:tetratricopeptide (TPR) repeat protein